MQSVATISGPASANAGGERGIRTLEAVAHLHAFQACAFDHSATSPEMFLLSIVKAGLTLVSSALKVKLIISVDTGSLPRGTDGS